MLAMLLVVFANAQTQTQACEERRLLATLYYEFDHIWTTSAELAKLDVVIEILKSDASIKVQIEGYCDPWGGKAINDRISQSRAQGVANYLLKHNVAESQIEFKGKGIDNSAASHAKARRVDVSHIVTVVIEPIQEPQKEEEKEEKEEPQVVEMLSEEEPIEEPVTEMQVEIESIPAAKKSIEGFSLRTNLLYWLVGNFNMGVEYRKPGSDFCFIVNGGYSPFGDTEWTHNLGGWEVVPEVRYYFPSNEQWFVGVQFLAAGYNFKPLETGSQGSCLGGGVMGGYKLTLSDRFDMDFTLGVGYGSLEYDVYYHDEATETNPCTEWNATKNSIIPIQVGVNLIWKIN